MRKIIAPPPRHALALSVEEEAILVDEQSAIVAEIAQNDEQVDRLLDMADVVDETVQIMGGVADVTPVEQQLVDAVADMAVAGTDANPEEIVTIKDSEGLVTESFGDKVVEHLKTMWEKIRKMILAAWEQIKKFFAGQKAAIDTAAKAQLENDAFVEAHKPALLLLPYDAAKDQAKKAEAAEREANAEKVANQAAADIATAEKQRADKADAEAKQKEQQANDRKARHEKAIKNLATTYANHKFAFKGHAGLVSTISGVPADFEKQLRDMLEYSQTSFKEVGRQLREISYSFDQTLGQMASAQPEKAVGPFCEKFSKSYEILMRSIGEVKDNDGLRTGRTKGYLLGHFSLEATDHAPNSAAKLGDQVKLASRATFAVTVGGQTKSNDVPLLKDTLDPAFGIAIKRWLDFAASNDVKSIEQQLSEYADKFVKHIDKLVDVQASVKGQAEGGDAYQLIQAMIDLARSLNKILIAFSTQHVRSALSVVRAVQTYQKESNVERVRLYEEAMKAAA